MKSADKEITISESEKLNTKKMHADLELIVKIAIYNMDSYIDYFKVEKLANYYKSLKTFSEIQASYSSATFDLWQTVGTDKNIQKLIKK